MTKTSQAFLAVELLRCRHEHLVRLGVLEAVRHGKEIGFVEPEVSIGFGDVEDDLVVEDVERVPDGARAHLLDAMIGYVRALVDTIDTDLRAMGYEIDDEPSDAQLEQPVDPAAAAPVGGASEWTAMSSRMPRARSFENSIGAWVVPSGPPTLTTPCSYAVAKMRKASPVMMKMLGTSSRFPQSRRQNRSIRDGVLHAKS